MVRPTFMLKPLNVIQMADQRVMCAAGNLGILLASDLAVGSCTSSYRVC